MHNEQDQMLRALARQAIAAGKVPRYAPESMWGGPGSAIECSICGKVVERQELEFELQFVREAGDPAPQTCHLHIRCLEAWQLERRVQEQPVAARSPHEHAAAPESCGPGARTLNGSALPEASKSGIITHRGELGKNQREPA
jgi:hypothetical protein